MARYDPPIRDVNPIEVIAAVAGVPICDCCGERLACIAYDGDRLCIECATDLAVRGEPVAQYYRQITPRR